jgi:hypothetical protein
MPDTASPTIIVLSPEDQKRLVEQILAPPEPTDALKRAARAHAVLIRPTQGEDLIAFPAPPDFTE